MMVMRRFAIATTFAGFLLVCGAAFAQPMDVMKPPATPPRPAPAMVAARPAPVAPAMVVVPKPAPAMPAAMAAAPTAKATAKDAVKDSFWKTFGGLILQILIVILTIALPIVLTPLVQWLAKKCKVEDVKTQQMIDEIVDKAVVHGLNYANEQAHKFTDNPVDSAKKLTMAADKAVAYLKDSGIVDKGSEYLKDLIESKLGETREANSVAKPEAPVAEEKPVEEEPKEEPDKPDEEKPKEDG